MLRKFELEGGNARFFQVKLCERKIEGRGQEVKGAQESGTYKECAYGKPDIRYWI